MRVAHVPGMPGTFSPRGLAIPICITAHASRTCRGAYQGVVSLTFRELSKIISRKYTTPEITFMIRISSWNLVRVPKAWLWAQVQSFSLKFWSQALFLQYTNFERIFWRARKTLVKQPPGSLTSGFLWRRWWGKRPRLSRRMRNPQFSYLVRGPWADLSRYEPDALSSRRWRQFLAWWPHHHFLDNKVHGANMGPIWGRQDPGGPHVGPMNFDIWVGLAVMCRLE